MKRVVIENISKCKKNIKSFKTTHAHLITSGLLLLSTNQQQNTTTTTIIVNKAVDFFSQSVDFLNYASDFLKTHCHSTTTTSSYPFNTLISQYACSESNPKAAFLALLRLRRDGWFFLLPDKFTFPAVLKACIGFRGIREGEMVHGFVVKLGFLCDLYVVNSLLHFYSVCGCLGSVLSLFDEMPARDVVSWTGIISGCVKSECFDEAVGLFLKMDLKPNVATFVSVLVACGKRKYLVLGRGIHGTIVKGTAHGGVVMSNAIMDMYAKCECLSEARQVFDEIREKDIVSWTCIISGLVRCERPKEALELFFDMQNSGVKPDVVILTSVLSACASLGALDHGRWVHEYVTREEINWDVQIGTAMVDMYAKCGCIDAALQIFNGIHNKNVQTWNALINGMAVHGQGNKALEFFEMMLMVGMRPNEVTFLAILTACCHAGLITEGCRFFHLMNNEKYNLSPRLEHYGCMVDLLCRNGLLADALKLVKTMPMPPDVSIIGALVSSCNINEIKQISEEILNYLANIESQDSGVYVVLSNIYASNQRWGDVNRIRKLMKERGIKKAPGSSVIEVNGKAHEFVIEDSKHPQYVDICTALKNLVNQIFLEEDCTVPALT